MRRRKTGRLIESAKAKLALLFFGAILILLIVPAMDAYAASVGGRNPTEYKLWEGLYVIFFLAVMFL